ncbi:MAG: phytase [Pseudomonadota bacterium]
MGGALKILIGVAALVAISFASFVIAVDHPTTRGPLRCWLQESFYQQTWNDPLAGTPIIEARLTTEPVRDMCDAADDPAIWVSDLIPGGVIVLGTNKQSSLNVYDVNGALLSRADAIGAPNNVDIRWHDNRAVAMVSDKDDAEIEAFELVLETGELRQLTGAPFAAEAEDEVYGFCMYSAGEALFAFTTDKSGMISQYQMDLENGTAEKVRELRVSTQPEGCVVDDVGGVLFVGEEDVGIWRFSAEPGADTEGALIARAGDGGDLTADIEGLSIYHGAAPDDGYLIASSQGDNTYAVFNRAPPHAFRGRFQVSFDGVVIGDTDGLAVTSKPIGDVFPDGLLVVQDGFIRDENGKRRNQRFAYVSWSDISESLDL